MIICQISLSVIAFIYSEWETGGSGCCHIYFNFVFYVGLHDKIADGGRNWYFTSKS